MSEKNINKRLFGRSFYKLRKQVFMSSDYDVMAIPINSTTEYTLRFNGMETADYGHWFLVLLIGWKSVVVETTSSNDCRPQILILDSSWNKTAAFVRRSKKLAGLMCMLLNIGTDRKVYSDETMPLRIVHVPTQDNGFDCGFHVCCFVDRMYEILREGGDLSDKAEWRVVTAKKVERKRSQLHKWIKKVNEKEYKERGWISWSNAMLLAKKPSERLKAVPVNERCGRENITDLMSSDDVVSSDESE